MCWCRVSLWCPAARVQISCLLAKKKKNGIMTDTLAKFHFLSLLATQLNSVSWPLSHGGTAP